MSLPVRHLYEFGEFRLDTEEKILLRGDEQLELTPKAFELLTLFVENPGRLLKKEEIMDKLWAESFVEESNLTFNIGQLRKLLGDDAQQPIFIKTVRQHGYRFIVPVREIVGEKESTETVENLSSKTIEDISKLVSETTNHSFLQHISKPNFAFIALAVLMILGLAGVLVLSGKLRNSKPSVPILQANFKSERLTNTGGVFNAVISPDGKQMAYTSYTGGKSGVWIRQLETSENIQVVPNSDEFYSGIKFSHDGKNLYFARGKKDLPQTIYRVSAMGGIPKEIVGGTQERFSLSPDDRQISFVRCPFADEEFCSLYIADADGKNEQRLLTRPRPIFIRDNQFSPDGNSIAAAIGQSQNASQSFSLIEVDVKSRTERELTNRKFFNIGHLRWLPDKSGLFFSAFERFYRPYKIYQVSNETGEVQNLTDDSNDYRQLSFDNSFQKMIATRTVPDYRLWIAQTDAINSAKPICSSQLGIAFTPSGKIIYTSITDGIHNIWTINADGANQRQLTSNQEANRFPHVSADERFIYFASNRTGSNQVWRMNMDGSNQIQISEGEGGNPIYVSADGNTVYYETALNNNLGKITFNNDGNKVSTIVSNERIRLAEINSAEDTAAYFSRTANQNFEITLMSLADGKTLKSFKLAEENSFPLKIVWANEGKSLFYLVRNDARKTIWQLSLETGKSEKFTEFSGDEEIEDFAFSADRKTFAYIRGKWEHDAFLITGLK